MLKNFLVCALVTSAALAPLSSAMATGSQRSLERWVGRVNYQIAEKFSHPFANKAGTAKIGFRRAADGRATDLIIIDGQSAVAEAAARTLRKLRNLPPLPAGFSSDQRITMNFIAGEPDGKYFADRARMMAMAAKSNARFASRVSATRVAALEPR